MAYSPVSSNSHLFIVLKIGSVDEGMDYCNLCCDQICARCSAYISKSLDNLFFDRKKDSIYSFQIYLLHHAKYADWIILMWEAGYYSNICMYQGLMILSLPVMLWIPVVFSEI